MSTLCLSYPSPLVGKLCLSFLVGFRSACISSNAASIPSHLTSPGATWSHQSGVTPTTNPFRSYQIVPDPIASHQISLHASPLNASPLNVSPLNACPLHISPLHTALLHASLLYAIPTHPYCTPPHYKHPRCTHSHHIQACLTLSGIL